MPSFAFGDDSPTTLALDPIAGGTLKLTVRNTTARPQTGHISVQSTDVAVPGWIKLEGAVPTAPNLLVVDFARSASQTVTVMVKPPAGAAVGRHVFNLRVAHEDHGDTDFAESPAVAFDVATAPAAAVPESEKARFPWAIVAAAVVVLLGASGAAWWLWPDSRVAVPNFSAPRATLVDAAQALDRLNLRVMPRPATQAGLADLQIIGTEPPAGTLVAEESTVVLIFNQAPNPSTPGGTGPRVDICARRPALCGHVLQRTEIRDPNFRLLERER